MILSIDQEQICDENNLAEALKQLCKAKAAKAQI
jgi:hypothetical protein